MGIYRTGIDKLVQDNPVLSENKCFVLLQIFTIELGADNTLGHCWNNIGVYEAFNIKTYHISILRDM